MNNPSDFRVLNPGEGPQDSRRDEAITPPEVRAQCDVAAQPGGEAQNQSTRNTDRSEE